MNSINKYLKNENFNASAPGIALREQPLGFVDIGARGGVSPIIAPIAGACEVLAFEPDSEECNTIQEHNSRKTPYAKFQIAPWAVGKHCSRQKMYLYKTASNNSFYSAHQPTAERYGISTFEADGTQEVSTTTLDQFLFDVNKSAMNWGEFIKLDAQGAEYDIFTGAHKCLSERTYAIVTEVEFFRMYTGQHLFTDVEAFLRSYGFSFYGFIKTSNRSRRTIDKHSTIGRERILWADAVFFKDPFQGGFFEGSLSERGYYILFVCALLLNYFDFALEIATKSWADGKELKKIHQFVYDCAYHSNEEAIAEAEALLQTINAKPDMANIEIGRFVDARRFIWDYDDVP